jgi:hypothetical protein
MSSLYKGSYGTCKCCGLLSPIQLCSLLSNTAPKKAWFVEQSLVDHIVTSIADRQDRGALRCCGENLLSKPYKCVGVLSTSIYWLEFDGSYSPPLCRNCIINYSTALNTSKTDFNDAVVDYKVYTIIIQRNLIKHALDIAENLRSKKITKEYLQALRPSEVEEEEGFLF